MNDKPLLEIYDMGTATDLTKGSAFNVPPIENGVPPYDHFWPYP